MKILDLIEVLQGALKEHGNLELSVSMSKPAEYLIEQNPDRAYYVPVDDDSEYGYHIYLRFKKDLIDEKN